MKSRRGPRRTTGSIASFALLNGVPTFLTLAAQGGRSHDVRLILPPAWKISMTGMPSAPRPHHYRAPDHESLVDSPILAGNPAVREFLAGGKPHYLVDIGGGGVFDGSRAVQGLPQIVAEDARFQGGLPYDRYLFLNILTGRGRGYGAWQLHCSDGRSDSTPGRFVQSLSLSSLYTSIKFYTPDENSVNKALSAITRRARGESP